MSVYAVPKPKKGKHKRAKNNPMPTAEDICTYPGCRRGYAHLHEDFGGKNRQLSIDYGLQRRLCYEHHNMPGGMNPHHNKDIAEQYKKESQAKFERLYGTREDFIRLFGRNYLDTV
jgi:hypothetical protein